MSDQASEARGIVEFLAALSERDDAAEMLAIAVARHPARFARVCLEFAAPDVGTGTERETPEEVLRTAHAAYSTGHRSPALHSLEKEYQRQHKARSREYQAYQDDRRKAALQAVGE